MSAVNNVNLIGRLCTDPEVRYNNDIAFARFNLAVQRDFKNKEGSYDADFITVDASNKTAEFIEKFFKKGDAICVQGNIRTGSYTNKDGVKVYTTSVNADKVGFVPGSSKSDSNNSESAKKDDGFVNVPEDIEEEMLPWN